MSSKLRLAPLALAVLCAACQEPERPPQSAHPPPTSTRALETVEGDWSAGDAASTWTATFEDGVLARIEETMALGEYGDGEAIYTFDGGVLARVEQVERTVSLELDGTARRDTTRTVVEVAADTVAAARQTQNGAEVPTHAAATALQHAHELASLAYRTYEERATSTARL